MKVTLMDEIFEEFVASFMIGTLLVVIIALFKLIIGHHQENKLLKRSD